ncbi:MAG: DUF433 domain-containing protein [Pirellulales bacterium]|nr:DUF433 domain-containing protein [Pirellulales bacterium]
MQPVINSHIEIRPNRDGQPRPYIAGTRIRVQDIVSDHERHGLSPEQIVREYPHLSLAQVHAALSYYFDHRDEVRECLRVDEQYARQAEAAQRASVGKDAHDDSLPS